MTIRNPLLAALLPCIGLQAASCSLKRAQPAAAAAGVLVGRNASVVAEISELNACGTANAGTLAFERKRNAFFACDGSAWTQVQIAAETPLGADGKALNGVLLEQDEAGPGAKCRYGGQRVRAGIDANADKRLQEIEVTSEIFSCDGGMERRARALFLENVSRVGMVYSVWRAAKENDPGAIDPASDCTSSGTGTAWVAGEDVVATNEHVVARQVNGECGTRGSVPFLLSSVYLVLPKPGYVDEGLLRTGIQQIREACGDFSRSPEPCGPHFDAYGVERIDRRPTLLLKADGPQPDGENVTDLAFLKVPGVSGAGRGAMALKGSGTDKGNGTDPNIDPELGDGFLSIGYPLSAGPKLVVGSIVSRLECRAQAALAGFFAAAAVGEYCRIRRLNSGDVFYRASGYSDKGDSGSPALDRFGQVFGIITFGNNPADRSDYADIVKVDDARDFLAKPRCWQALAAAPRCD